MPRLRFGAIGLVVALSACSSLEGDKVNYRSASRAPTLEIPPDLTQLAQNNRYAVPGSAVTASSYQGQQAAQPVAITAVQALGDLRLERAGNQQWLVVDRKPEQLWDSIRDFWQQSGFVLTTDQVALGIMETDWAENRAKLPQDVIRNTIGKLFDALYSTGEQDRFRTRLERNASGGTDIFISHRGMVEVYANVQKDRTIWQPRSADIELEAEFLKRLMQRLGTPEGQPANTRIAVNTGSSAVAAPTARVIRLNNQPAVQIDDAFDRAWRRVGLSLDRSGFTVEDRDRAQGTYFVRYVEADQKKTEPGFIAKLFGGSAPAAAPLKLRIVLSNSANPPTTVSVQSTNGASETSPVAQRIVDLLADSLK
jgi:outer membrane protein assembly factor BamC